MTALYRKRLIPSECIHLKEDQIIDLQPDRILTRWKTLHPKEDFSHGLSCYCLDNGWKISKFLRPDNSLAYIYCDIIDTHYDPENDTYTFTDLLADVIIEKEGLVRVVDLDELADACSGGIISNEMLVCALHRLDRLLSVIYNGSFQQYIQILDRYS